MRFSIKYNIGEWEKEVRLKYDPLAIAATAAMHQVGEQVKQAGRADIMAAGFSQRWANAFRVEVYPKGRTASFGARKAGGARNVSVNAAAWVYHKIPYAGVFETGAVIRGKPLMWVPTRHAPTRTTSGGKSGKLTPDRFAAQFGSKKLVPYKSAKGTPLLGVRISVGRGQTRSFAGRLTASEIKKGKTGAGKGRRTQMVPLFVGIRVVNIRKRFHITQIVERAAAQLAAAFLANFKDE